jgi:sulfide:quinone oxidoreductase
MQIHQINEQLAIAPQISPAIVPALAEHGFKSIINNRPDHEEPGQATHAEIATAAEALGIQVIHQPVLMSTINQQDAAVFAQHLQALPGPILAFCRTGRRCMTLYHLSQAQ